MPWGFPVSGKESACHVEEWELGIEIFPEEEMAPYSSTVKMKNLMDRGACALQSVGFKESDTTEHVCTVQCHRDYWEKHLKIIFYK